MKFFRRKPNVVVKTSNMKDHDNRVEVVVHKNATEESLNKAKQANEKLNELLVENGFTLKIYLAAHGPASKHRKGR